MSRSALVVIGVLLMAATLRAPFTNLAPLLDIIRQRFDLGAVMAGVLTTLPLLAFAVVSPFAGRVARVWGLERALFGAMALVAVGVAIRSIGFESSLFVGTSIIGGGIAIGNVLLPSLVKRDFPGKVALMTSCIVLTMAVAAAIGSVIVVPIARHPEAGWQGALVTMIVLPVVALVAWLPQLARRSAPDTDQGEPLRAGNVWKSLLAWQVTAFMGLVSLQYYIVAGWLPSILIASGYSAESAGRLHGILQLASGFPGFVLVPLMQRLKDQRLLAMAVAMLSAVSLSGLALLPQFAFAWVFMFGFSSGIGIVLGLSFLSLRSSGPREAAALSGMVQCIGYTLAAAGPPIIGRLHEMQGNWAAPILECAALCSLMAWAGCLAGRDLRLGQERGR